MVLHLQIVVERDEEFCYPRVLNVGRFPLSNIEQEVCPYESVEMGMIELIPVVT